jgi:phosphoribosyl 1,2-cyclic phosphodiesterase
MGVDLVKKAGVERLILFHHGREDTKIAEIESNAREQFSNTVAAYEGLEIFL